LISTLIAIGTRDRVNQARPAAEKIDRNGVDESDLEFGDLSPL
jgi:hypothetical protein